MAITSSNKKSPVDNNKQANYETLYQDWKSGKVSNEEALLFFSQSLAVVDDNLGPLENAEKLLRSLLSEVVEASGGSAEIPGFGKLRITAPAVVESYNKIALDKLVLHLFQNANSEVAQQILGCKETKGRVGSLTITRDKTNN